jgi:hypothetical protein
MVERVLLYLVLELIFSLLERLDPTGRERKEKRKTMESYLEVVSMK